MKLGRRGWGLKRLSLARFQRNRAMGFGESVKNGSQRRCFLSRDRRTTSATFLGSISAKLPTNTCPGGISRQMHSHCWKVSIKGSNLPKTLFLWYFRVPCLCSAYWSRETFCDAYTLFHPPSGHPTDLSFVGDFCWGMYLFPAAIHLPKCPFATASVMGIPGWGHSCAPCRVGSPICSGIIIHGTFSSYDIATKSPQKICSVSWRGAPSPLAPGGNCTPVTPPSRRHCRLYDVK